MFTESETVVLFEALRRERERIEAERAIRYFNGEKKLYEFAQNYIKDVDSIHDKLVEIDKKGGGTNPSQQSRSLDRKEKLCLQSRNYSL